MLVVTDPNGDPRDTESLVEALRQGQFLVDEMMSYQFPRDALSLMPYDCIVVPNVPAMRSRTFRHQAERIVAKADLGRQRAVTAAQGTTMEGSPLMVLEDAAAEAELEALHIRQGGQARAGALIKQGKTAQATANMQAGQTLLGGVASAISMGAKG